MPVRKILRGVLERVAARVGKDGLFEQPGERVKSEPLPVRPEPEPVGWGPPNPGEKPTKSTAAKRAGTTNETPAASPAGPPAESPVPTPAAAVSPASPPTAAAAATAASPAPTASPKMAASAAPAKVTASRPKEGCVPVDLSGLLAAVAPSGKPLVVNHWATWCDPCVDELPRLVRAAAGVADVGEFIGVSWDLFDHPGKPLAVAKKVGQFADSSGVGYASVLFTGTPDELFAALSFDVHTVPQTLVIAPDGRVVYHKKGVIEHDDVFPLIAAVKACAS